MRRPKGAFDARTFLDSVGVARKIRRFKKAEIVFSQGTLADSVMYIQEGGVQITVLSAAGKEAIIATLGPGDFFGWRRSAKVGSSIKVAPGRRRLWPGCRTIPYCTSADCDFCWCRRKKVCTRDSRTCE